MSLNYIITSPCHITDQFTSQAQFTFDNGINQINIETPISLSTSYIFTLPEDDGNPDDLLYSEGTATTFWGTIGFRTNTDTDTFLTNPPPIFTTNSTTYINLLDLTWPFANTDIFLRGIVPVSKSDVVPTELRFSINSVTIPGSFRTFNTSTSGAFHHVESQCIVNVNNGDDIRFELRNAVGSLNPTEYNNRIIINFEYF